MTVEEELARLLDDALVVGDWVKRSKPSSTRAEPSGSDDSPLPYIGPDGRGWPKDKIPVEIFEAIGSYLLSGCLRNCRLVCKEFDRKMSHALFTTVVVPFQPELYGGIETSSATKAEQKGKGKAIAQPDSASEDIDTIDGNPSHSHGDIARTGNSHQGMKVFKDWGSHINKFGLSFDVSEGMISFLPDAIPRVFHRSFWGSYEWSHEHTHRFRICERLETTANRSQSMTVAFSTLSHVNELAISMVDGLGWLSGPDMSWRARFLKTKPPVFRSTDSQVCKSKELWMAMAETHDPRRNLLRSWAFDTGYFNDVLAVIKAWNEGNGRFFATTTDDWRMALSQFTPYQMVTSKASDFMEQIHLDDKKAGGSGSGSIGHTVTNATGDTITTTFTRAPLIPKHLTAAQKEYLLEMTWAQRTFLASYTIAVIDNKAVFKTVRTLNIASLSSRYIPSLRQHDFWAALPNLQTLKLTISPDWRDILRDERGLVDSPAISPSTAVTTLSVFLQEFISPLETVKTLSLGWLDGGEHAIGTFGRNQHVLCAPLIVQQAFWYHGSADNIVCLPHVLQLTLNNCWISPSVLELFVQQHKITLQDLSLNSVSLTAPARPGLWNRVPQVWFGRLDAPAQQPRSHTSAPYSAAYLSRILSYVPRPGSWPWVIKNIAADTGLVEPRNGGAIKEAGGALRRIQFHSCGYVFIGSLDHLTADLNQGGMERYIYDLPTRLQVRREQLQSLMMSADDPMLGEIIPHMPEREVDTLHVLWHMSFGWGDDPRARDNLKDGFPEGGSGRFSGSVERAE